MNRKKIRLMSAVLCMLLIFSCATSAMASVSYMPDVTAEMSDASYWSALQPRTKNTLLSADEIKALNQGIMDAKGTSVMDLKNAAETFDGVARNEAIKTSATSDAEYYFGWTYGGDGKKADWSYYQKMIDNCKDRKATKEMPVRYGIAVSRTVLQVFPSENPIWDDPTDPDFDYQALSGIRVNEPLLIYTTSADGKYYLARISCCSGWVKAEDIALCADKEEWLSAWDLPSEQLLVVYGNKVYTDMSNSHPEISRRMLTMGTALELVPSVRADELIGNRSPFHNYVVYLPVRSSDGSYSKEAALLPETAKVSEGYLPLTQENIAMVALGNLGDAYGWGGMMDVEDCSSFVRMVYACFGLDIARNGNWQWNMPIEKIDMSNMSLEEKYTILDEMPLGAALCFSGHEMMYLGKVNGKYYVISTASKVMSPTTGKTLRTRGVMINTLDTKRANGHTWMQDLNKAMMPCYAESDGKDYAFQQTQWYHDGVAYCLSNGVMSSRNDGSFGLSDHATRGDLVNAFWVMAGKPSAEKTCSFADVSSESSSYTAICWAVENGIMNGVSETEFGANASLTREQLAAVLQRYAALQQVTLSDNGATLSAFRDAKSISSYAKDAVAWAYRSGLLSGTTAKTISPSGTATRAQLAVILCRYNTQLTAALSAKEAAAAEAATLEAAEAPAA